LRHVPDPDGIRSGQGSSATETWRVYATNTTVAATCRHGDSR
jgi:hypothetical protein